MINDKTIKRIRFAREYEGDDYTLNPQLKYMMARNVEPHEVKKGMQKARVVQ